MNESELENELRAMRPRPPSEALARGIARELRVAKVKDCAPRAGRLPERAAPLRRVLAGLCWACGGAAAAIVAMALLFTVNPSALSSALAVSPGENGATPAGFEAVESAQEFIAAEDGGLLLSEDREPAQMVRFSSVERHAWLNPATGARVEIEVPREDLVLLPVAFQ